MKYKLGSQMVGPEGRYLTVDLRDSSDAIDKPAILHDQMEEDGFLFIRGFHDSATVLAARKDIIQILHERG